MNRAARQLVARDRIRLTLEIVAHRRRPARRPARAWSVAVTKVVELRRRRRRLDCLTLILRKASINKVNSSATTTSIALRRS